MKRVLLVLSAAVLFFGTFVTPTVVMADGGSNSGGTCGNTMCKPLAQ